MRTTRQSSGSAILFACGFIGFLAVILPMVSCLSTEGDGSAPPDGLSELVGSYDMIEHDGVASCTLGDAQECLGNMDCWNSRCASEQSAVVVLTISSAAPELTHDRYTWEGDLDRETQCNIEIDTEEGLLSASSVGRGDCAAFTSYYSTDGAELRTWYNGSGSDPDTIYRRR